MIVVNVETMSCWDGVMATVFSDAIVAKGMMIGGEGEVIHGHNVDQSSYVSDH